MRIDQLRQYDTRVGEKHTGRCVYPPNPPVMMIAVSLDEDGSTSADSGVFKKTTPEKSPRGEIYPWRELRNNPLRFSDYCVDSSVSAIVDNVFQSSNDLDTMTVALNKNLNKPGWAWVLFEVKAGQGTQLIPILGKLFSLPRVRLQRLPGRQLLP